MPIPTRLPSKKTATKTFGNTGNEYYSGYFSDEPKSKWRDQERVDNVKEMISQDGTVRAILEAIKSPILDAPYDIHPASDEKQDIEIAEDVKCQLEGMKNRTFDEWLREGLTFYEYGHSVFEKIWGIGKDGRIYLKDLAPRIQASIESWKTENGEPGVTQLVNNDGTYEEDGGEDTESGSQFSIPIEKLVVLTNEKEGDNLTGRSVLRSAYIHYYMKNKIYRIQTLGIEKNAVGIPVGKFPAKASPAQKNDFESMLKNVRANKQQHMLLPDGYEFEIVTPGSNPLGSSVKDAIEHHDRRILLAVLAEFLDLGSGGGGGSYALSKDQQSFFLKHIQQKAKYIASVINRQVIRNMVDYNYEGVEKYPEFKFAALGDIDFKEMSEVLKNLVDSGFVNPYDEEEQKHVRNMFKFPMLSAEAESPKQKPQKDRNSKDGAIDPEKEKEGSKKLHALAEKKKTFHRDLTIFEERVNFALLEETLDTLESKLTSNLADLLKNDLKGLDRKIAAIIKSGNVSSLANLEFVDAKKLERAIQDVKKESYEVGKTSAAGELDVGRPTTPVQDTQALKFESAELATQVKNDVESKAKQVAKDSIVKGAAKSAAVAAVAAAATTAASSMVTNLAGFVVNDDISKGRRTVFKKNVDNISGYIRTEVLDQKTCNVCLSLDGRIIKADDPMAELGSVHTNCRGQWVAIRVGDIEKTFVDPVKKTETTYADLVKNGVLGIPKSVVDQFMTIGGVPRINAFTQLKKPINSANDGVQKIVKEKMEK